MLDKPKDDNGKARDSFLFQHLVVMFQTLALQQMGKLTSPITGEMERDLHQAKITIDMLNMLQDRTRDNLEDEEKRLLDTVIMELQMNYIDETARTGEDGDDEEAAEDHKDVEEDPENAADSG
jgi:hypothetical protein